MFTVHHFLPATAAANANIAIAMKNNPIPISFTHKSAPYTPGPYQNYHEQQGQTPSLAQEDPALVGHTAL